MLERSTTLLEQLIDEAMVRLAVVIEEETQALLASWAKRFPRYEVQIGRADLVTFRYRIFGIAAEWEELNHYKPMAYEDGLRTIAEEADAYSTAWCDLDHRISAPTETWVGLN